MNKNIHVVHFFSFISHWVANILGSYKAFLLAAAIVFVWLIAGQFMGYSTEWQAIINCITGVITFFLVIFIQHTQNHATKALHLKLDELIRATERARNKLVELEKLNDEDLNDLHNEFGRIRDEALRRDELKNKAMSNVMN